MVELKSWIKETMASTAPTRMRQQTCEPGDQTGKGRKIFPGASIEEKRITPRKDLDKSLSGKQKSTTSIIIIASLLSLADLASGTVLGLPEPRIDFENKIYSACSTPLTSCPQSDNKKNDRVACMFGSLTGNTCPEGSFYGCGEDDETGFRVEDCFKKNCCPAGSSNRVRLDLDQKKAHLECVGCDSDHFQHYESDSSIEPLTGCREERISTTLKNEMHTMILVEVGWPTRPDRYACDTSKNYSDANHNMYCFVNRPCHCVQDFACSDPSTPDLLPNRSCDARCNVDRLQLHNFSCPRYGNRGTTQEYVSVAVNITTEKTPHNQPKGPTARIVVLCIFTVLVVVIFGIVCLYCFVIKERRTTGRRRRQGEQSGQILEEARKSLSNMSEENPDDENSIGNDSPDEGNGPEENPDDENSSGNDSPDERNNPEENPDDENSSGNDSPDERHDPGRASPRGPRVLQKTAKTKTAVGNMITVKGGKNVIINIHEPGNDKSSTKHPDPRNIAAESSNSKQTDKEPTLSRPVQEQGDLDKNRYSDLSLPSIDADNDEETDRKEIISCEETEPKLKVLKEVSL